MMVIEWYPEAWGGRSMRKGPLLTKNDDINEKKRANPDSWDRER